MKLLLDDWFEMNKNTLYELYFSLINISKTYTIDIINDNQSFTNFVKMVYNESLE
jgi:hypothetical protein